MSSSKYAEPFRIKSVEMLKETTPEYRRKVLEGVGYNLFKVKADDIYIDCLTDSGTSAMSDRQWAALMTGDESYVGNRCFYDYEKAIQDLFGFQYVIPTHQGRAAEQLLARMLYPKRPQAKYVLANMAFDSTRAAAIIHGVTAIDLLEPAGYDTIHEHPFKGNLSTEKLEAFIQEHGVDSIAWVQMIVTCNSNGGQPVSMANIKACGEIAHKYGLAYIADCARCFENAYFIKEREPGYQDKTIREICLEMFSYFDYAFMSIKKDGLVNMGGFFCCREQSMYDVAWVDNMNYEGHATYGGLAGRDLAAIAVGLYEGSDYRYLKGRIGQVQYLGERLDEFGVPYVRPVGGNGVYIDARKFYPDIAPEHFPGLCLAADLYLKEGIRVSELGASAFSYKDDKGVIHYPEIDLVRIAISRRVYTNSHMDLIAETLGELFRSGSPNFKGMDKSDWYGATTHFTSSYTPMFK